MNLQLENLFKPEVRAQGERLRDEGAVHLAVRSDTRVEAYLRVGTRVSVKLKADSISSRTIVATCTCPQFGRGQYCKHLWATLLEAGSSAPDFLEAKVDLTREEREEKPKERPKIAANPEREAAEAARRVRQKETQSEYRKAQYRLQKERVRERKREERVEAGATRKASAQHAEVPEEIAPALRYFETNGFPLSTPIDLPALENAKRLLSRVFHPDRGGSHEEILELNQNFDKLKEFSRGQEGRGSRH